MNKSTPINQLPSSIHNQAAFINESQRQIVTNAQNAVGNMNMPQNTQNNIDADDDAEIQDALNDVNAQLGLQASVSSPPPPPSLPKPPVYSPNIPSIPVENPSDVMFLQGAQYTMPPMQHASYSPQAPSPVPPMTLPTVSYMDYVVRFSNELKLALLVLLAVFAVHFIPFDSMIGKYFAIDKIPYHDILVKAFFTAVIVVTIKALVL